MRKLVARNLKVVTFENVAIESNRIPTERERTERNGRQNLSNDEIWWLVGTNTLRLSPPHFFFCLFFSLSIDRKRVRERKSEITLWWCLFWVERKKNRKKETHSISIMDTYIINLSIRFFFLLFLFLSLLFWQTKRGLFHCYKFFVKNLCRFRWKKRFLFCCCCCWLCRSHCSIAKFFFFFLMIQTHCEDIFIISVSLSIVPSTSTLRPNPSK